MIDRLPVRVVLAALGGATLSAAFPGLDWWPLALLGTAIILWSLAGLRPGAALLVGAVAGFAFYGIHIFWLTTYLGPVPWLALAGLQTLFFALGALLLALAWEWLPRALPGRLGLLLLAPTLAGLWTLREGIAAVWPYGGFSWGRLAFSQSQSPLGELAAWFGASGLSFALALIAAIFAVSFRPGSRRSATRWPQRPLPGLLALGLALLLPAWPSAASITGPLRVAAVQGNADAGLYSQRNAGDILTNHIDATLPLLDEKVDLLIWPENASDIDPLRYPLAARSIAQLSQRMDTPMVFGTITKGPDDTTFNSLLLWQPGEGPVAQYDKMHPVPFAEYLPDREFWYPLAPALFDLVPRDFSIGERPNVFDIDGVAAGLAICFDIVDDALLREMMAGGAEIILAPTNNADFGRSDESVQQLAIARLRAIEYGRSVVNISTVGTSAIIDPTGATLAQLPTFEPGAMVEDVPLATGATPAALFGAAVEWLVSAFGLGALLAAGVTVAVRSRLARNRTDLL